jgi:hypothetical protein
MNITCYISKLKRFNYLNCTSLECTRMSSQAVTQEL